MSYLRFVLLALCLFAAAPVARADQKEYREMLVQAILSEEADKQAELIKKLVGASDSLVERALAAWRQSELYLFETADGAKVPILLDAQQDNDGKVKGIRLLDGEFLKGPDGKTLALLTADLTAADTSSKLRKSIKTTLDLFALGNPNPRMRRDAVIKLGQDQNPDYIPHFEERAKIEKDHDVQVALREAVATTQIGGEDAKERLAAVVKLGEMRSINGLTYLLEIEKKARAGTAQYDAETLRAVSASVAQIQNYIWWGNLFGTAFRGFSLAAVLLVAALGLAITFGLMGVINMAHGEIMAIGAYSAFVVQGIFGKGLMLSVLGKSVSIKGYGMTGGAFDSYFIVALIVSFLTAATAGLLLERGIIRFLYKRPLESLLATWGVSLVFQQVFRHTFGAANVQVDAPSFLSGSFVICDVLFAYNRIFIIGFALFVVALTWALLTKTSLGLQIRAVMQNRVMASCMGVRTDRVNMMTFAFGCGLAGMAGACLSQIANVGPSLGQSYIIDCFMVVVLGGVGNLVGTVSASAGVGVTNQILEPWLGAVLGKITVLAAIILFLQWRPSGLFVTRSRSLEG